MQPARSRYIFVIVNVPDPVHPPVPVKFHVPVIVLLATFPSSVTVFPLGVPDMIVSWKAPMIFPLEFWLRTNDPVCDPPEVKQLVDVVKVRFVPVTVAVPLPWVRDVVNAKAGVPSVFASVADQLPVTVGELLELPPPHPISTKPNTRTIAIKSCFIMTPDYFPLEPVEPTKVAPIKARKRVCGAKETAQPEGRAVFKSEAEC
jgi:hypothetical protein